MPKLLRNELTTATVRSAEPGEHADGSGLALRVKRSGARSWVQRLRVHGRPVSMGLGSADLVTLREARDIALENRRIARQGGDPRRAKVPTFAVCAEKSYAKCCQEWKDGSKSITAVGWRQRMANYVIPKIGQMPVDKVGTRAVEDMLRPIALAGKSSNVKFVGNHIARVLRDAAIAEHRDLSDPVAVVLASLPKRKTAVRHARALPHSDVGAALAKLDAAGSRLPTVVPAIRFLALTGARGGESAKPHGTKSTSTTLCGQSQRRTRKPTGNTAFPCPHRPWTCSATRASCRAASKSSPDKRAAPSTTQHLAQP